MSAFGQSPLEGLRHCQYAGTWYEGDAQKLTAQLKQFLKSAADDEGQQPVSKQPLLAIVAPHAGYVYSGKTAAVSYQAASKTPVKRVFLMGPSHHMRLHGVALPLAVSFETPLGPIDVDKETVAELRSYPLFALQPDVHRVEHSLELQLPFIKQVFPQAKIVPLVVGDLSDSAEVRLVAEVLKGYVTENDVIVVSSDFTHYGPRYGYEPFKANIKSNIEKLDKEAFAHLAKKDVDGFLEFQERTHDTICGFYPCAVLCAMLPEDATAQLLKYATSQDSLSEDKDNSVSYLSIAFYGSHWPDNPRKRVAAEEAVNLSEADKKSLLEIARKTLESYVSQNKRVDASSCNLPITGPMKQCFGAFVTLYKRSKSADEHRKLHPDRELRGCIGSIWPVKPLYQTVAENAISACSKDYRFDPVKPDELKDLEIEISILTPPRRASSYKDIVLGKDGIILSKYDRQAVFLPFVPTEFGWDLPETLRQLSVKAGLRDNDWKDGAKYDLFQSVSIEEK